MKLNDDQWMEIFAVNCVHGKSYADDQKACLEQAEIMLNNPESTWAEAKEEIKISLQEKYPKP